MSAKFSTGELRWLLRRIRPFMGLQLAYLATLVTASFLAILDPLILKWLVDDIIPWRKSEMLLVAGGAFVLTFLLRYSLSGIGGILNFYCSERVVFNIRLEVLRHLQGLSSSFHDSTSPGELMHRIEQDTMQIANLSSQLFTTLVRVVTTTMLTLIVMLLLSWQMTLFVLPLVPGVMILRRYVHPRLRQAADDAQQAAGRRTAFLQDQLAAMDQVQVLRQEASQRRRFLSLSRRVLEVKVRQQSWDIFLMLSSLLISVVAMAVALTYGGHQVLAGQLTLGGLIAFYTYVSRFFEPMQSVASLYSSLQASGASIRRIQELLAARSDVREAPDAQRLRRDIPGRVRFADVGFSYGETPLLRGVSLDIEPGERLALVGESGSGKTSLLKLLVRLYDAEAGRITVGDMDVRRLRLGDLRQRVALVPQAPVLFDTSLRENLRYGHRAAGRDELDEVARVARLREVIDRVGWDAPVGPRGSKLSGGERQRVAIARALLSRPRVLLLDEATSALDGPGERRLFRNLVEFLGDTTLVFITHRLATVDWADRVVVMAAGEIVEAGRPGDLYRAAGPYRALCEAQQIEAPEPVPTLVSA